MANCGIKWHFKSFLYLFTPIVWDVYQPVNLSQAVTLPFPMGDHVIKVWKYEYKMKN